METTTTTRDLKRRKTLTWLIAVLSLLIVVSHNFFPVKDTQLQEIRSDYNKTLDTRDALFLELSDAHAKKDQHKINDVLSQYVQKQNIALKQYDQLKKRKSRIKFLGFNNANVFFFHTGVFFALFFISILLRYLTLQLEYDSLKKAYSSASFVFTALSFYYILWSFYSKPDLPYYVHLLVVVLVSCLMSVVVQKLIKWLYDREAIISINKINFKNLWRFIIKDIPSKHIPEANLDSYVDDYVKEIEVFQIPNFREHE